MNILLLIGLLLIVGYAAGWLFELAGLPKVIAYIITGIVFSPGTIVFTETQIVDATQPLLEVSLSFIAFEVGGTLKWSKIKEHEREIISITLMASFIPFIFITAAILVFGMVFPHVLSLDFTTLLLLGLLLGALAGPTAPAATFAVIRQYKSKGKVTDTILGVVALDDVLGVLFFSLVIAFVSLFTGVRAGGFENPLIHSLYGVFAALAIGVFIGIFIDFIAKSFRAVGEGQWVVIIFSLIIFNAGISQFLGFDMLLSSMFIGIVVVNRCIQRKLIFRILERYTEDLIFLFFFILSGLHLDVSAVSQASFLIFVFVVFRLLGKFAGVNIGARIVNAEPSIKKYTAGGLLPQAGIVIGLVLSIYQNEQFRDISELLLAIIMGATIIHELIGPVIAKQTLIKAGEIKLSKKLRQYK